ncbi:hypothetical protein [Ruegeria lacuscaerulensis]|uniref:hypothetical protein n=1 Tax=Ruegeria lacuscaerulensis TaxID=55218 RepID=UPI00147F9AA0|nr:hypothetical protein [Ruegeria lacuscaerulensis]
MDFFQDVWASFSNWVARVFDWLPAIDGSVGLGFDIATMLTIIGATGLFLREQARTALSKNRFQIRQEASSTAAGILVSFIERISRLQSDQIAGHLDVLHNAWRAADMIESTAPYFKKEVTESISKIEQNAYEVFEDTLETRYTLKPVMSALGHDKYFDEFWENALKVRGLIHQLRSGSKLLSLTGEFEQLCEEFSSRNTPPSEEEASAIIGQYVGSIMGQDSDFLSRTIFKEVSWVYETLRPEDGNRVGIYLRGVKDAIEDHNETEDYKTLVKELGNFYMNALTNNGRVYVDGKLSEPLPRVVFRGIEESLMKFTTQIQFMLSDTSCALGLVLSHKEFTDESFEVEKTKYREELKAGILTR